MGWGVYVKETHASQDMQTDSKKSAIETQTTLLPLADMEAPTQPTNLIGGAPTLQPKSTLAPKPTVAPRPVILSTRTPIPTTPAEITGITTDSSGTTVTVKGTPTAIRYSTDSVSNAAVTLINGRHTIVWPQGTTFACYQAKGSNGIWTSIYCNSVTPGASAPTFTPTPVPTATPTPTSTAVPTLTHTPTPTPTPPAACGSGGACTTAQIATHTTRSNCWVYLTNPSKAYNITNYVTNGSSDHPGGDIIVSYCGGNIQDVFIGSAGEHRHSNSALNSVLQAYYIGPFQ